MNSGNHGYMHWKGAAMNGRTMRQFARATGAVILTLVATSCTTGPDYTRPSMAVPASYKSVPGPEINQPNLSRQWWRLFNDAELNALAEEALAANQSVKAAMARVAQSRASARSVKSAFYPVVTMDPSATRSRTPGAEVETDAVAEKLSQATSALNQLSSIANKLSALQGGGTTDGTGSTGSLGTSASSLSSTSETSTSVPATTSNRFQVPFDFSYEIDLWGRIRRSYESAEAQAQATEYDLEVVRQTLLADLARNYFNLRSFDAQYAILDRNLALFKEQVELTGNQYKAGLVNATNPLQATVQYESTRAQAADTLRQRTDLEHAIAILLGRAPADFSLPTRPLEGTPPIVPAGLPSDLLERRPDVAEAEQSLLAANAEIGVAQAEFFPSVKLTGSAGFGSSDIKTVLDWSNRTWSFGPSVSVPLFKGGQLKADLQKAKARYDELEANYRGTVLTAFVDVEDSLTDLHMRADAADAQRQAVDAAREYLRLTQIEYRSGLIDYLNVVNAEQTLMSNELSDAQLLNQRMVSTVLLIKALGGGWDVGAPAVAQAAPANAGR